jgi:ribosomal protein S18 acetylase RimI-like enzyme
MVTLKELDERSGPWESLLEADPSRKRVESYLGSGTLVGMFENDSLLGVFVLTSLEANTVELMNIAVHSDYRGRGFGKLLLAEALRCAQAAGPNRLRRTVFRAGIWFGLHSNSIDIVYTDAVLRLDGLHLG